ncbi:LacI family DNA-binding transcriptional regulator, partial [Limnochorda pilosa]|uniref:LacI family DNA-binding transcriptional regulator n=1 Tax=Limnochorda pilosa TaxID=1555112 RepID=UPI0026EFF62C
MRRATIKDIAALAGVSTATVSKALNNKPDVSEATRARVWEAARALNYQQQDRWTAVDEYFQEQLAP